MASSGPADSPENTPGIVASLRTLAASGVGIVRTRLELFANELEEERVRALQIAVLGIIAIFCGCVALLLATAWIVVALWDQYRLLTLAVLAFAYLAGALVAVSVLRAKAAQRPKLFSASLAELRRDQDLLRS
jgi:uncharacterized membrane protein YqjE